MNKELETVQAVEIESANIEVGDWGLTFTGQLTTQEWLEAVLSIQKFDGKIQWYLGDLAVYAESPTTGWGESKYDGLIEATGYEYITLSKFGQIARRFSPEWRESFMKTLADVGQHLSFSHFMEVKSLDDNFAEYWLKKAAENGWGVARLREKINIWKNGEPVEKASSGGVIPTPAQEAKSIVTWAMGLAKSEGAEAIRVQVVKNGKVLDEQVMELEVE